MDKFIILLFKLIIYDFALNQFKSLIGVYFTKFKKNLNKKFKNNLFTDLSKFTFYLSIIVVFEKVETFQFSYSWLLNNGILHLFVISLVFLILSIIAGYKLEITKNKKKCRPKRKIKKTMRKHYRKRTK